MKPDKTKQQGNETQMQRLLGDKRVIALLSLLLAFLAWLFVVTLIDPSQEKDFVVPVDFTHNAVFYTGQGLDIVEKPNKSITVKVAGDGNVLNTLAANDILVYPDYSSVKRAGSYTLKLNIERRGSGKNFDILTTTEQTVEVRFDKMITQKFPVTVLTSGIEAAPGYLVDTPVSSPVEVTLTGPESEMTRVKKVVAKVELHEMRSESSLVTAKLAYLGEDDVQLTTNYITADVNQVEVTVPVLQIKELPLTLEYSGVPAGFDPAQLRPKMSQTTIRVAGSATQLEGLESISAGYIDLTKFQLGEPVTCAITLPEGLRNVDNLQNVTVTFNTVGYTKKTVTVTKFSTINVPAGTTITYPVELINNVVLIGTQEELDALEESGVVAQVDASAANLTVRKGQQNIAVKIIIPSTQTVFATGTYSVLCNIETQDPAAQAASASNEVKSD